MTESTFTSRVGFAAALVGAVVTLALPANVEARERGGSRGFIEAAIGQAAPVGEDEWENTFDSTLKLGLRGGAWGGGGLGFEAALDYTPLDSTEDSLLGVTLRTDVSRFRLLIGGRFGADLARNVRLFGRVLIGADYMRGSYEGNAPIVGDFSGDDSDTGLGAEVGGGVAINLANVVSVGAQLAIPMAFHFTEQDVQNEQYIDYDYNAFDVDFMVTVGTSF